MPKDATNSPVANFDRLARAYRWMEYLSFGPMLERCRFRHLDACRDARRALVLGDGDGRFTARLLAENQELQADVVDASTAMLSQLRNRVANNGTRLRTFHADIRCFAPADSEYDMVATHFFLDCLTQQETASLIERIVPNLTPNAIWLVSEFAIPKRGWRRPAARLLIQWLYFAFSKLTGLHVRRIPDYSTALAHNGLQRLQQVHFLGGLLVAELWGRKHL